MGRSKESRRTRGRHTQFAHKDDSAAWSASKSAQTLVEVKALTAERLAECDVLHAMMLSDTINQYSQFTDILRSSGSAHPENDALIRMGRPELIANQSMAAFEESETNRIRQMVRFLELDAGYIVSPAIHSVIVAAAQTITDEESQRITWSDLPAPHGFLLLPTHLMLYPTDEKVPYDLIAFSWNISEAPVYEAGTIVSTPCVEIRAWIDADGPVKVDHFTAVAERARQAGRPFPPLLEVHCSGIRPTGDQDGAPDLDDVSRDLMNVSLSSNAAETSGGGPGYESGDAIRRESLQGWSQKYVLAFMRLAQQQIATVAEFRDGIHPSADPRPHHDTRVVQLRSYTSEGPRPDAAADSGRKYDHRFVVRMHKVKQWYPKAGVHKLIWRGPFIKGPENAPLLRGEKVNAFVRQTDSQAADRRETEQDQ